MELVLYLEPDSVSFSQISWQEVVCLRYEVSGYFQNPRFNGEFAHTTDAGAGNWLDVGVDNCAAIDTAAFRGEIPWLTPDGRPSSNPVHAWTLGYATMYCPWGWHTNGTRGATAPYQVKEHGNEEDFMITPEGQVGVRKFYQTVIRSTNGCIRLNGKVVAP